MYKTDFINIFLECEPPCAKEQFGCCDDNTTAAHGPNKEGCCLDTQYGCCPDNIVKAKGPNLQGIILKILRIHTIIILFLVSGQ